jgi:thioredoxin-related protein
MRIRLVLATVSAVAALSFATARADKAETFDQARALSAQSGKPILLEFNHDDCIHCRQATAEFDSIPEIKQALESVILLKLSVLQGEGTPLAEEYKVGNSFPVFFITDTAGRVCTRWTGYTGSDRFLATLKQGLSDRLTIDEREAQCRKTPSSADLMFLANYFTDSREYPRALDYCRRLQNLEKGVNLGFRIFKIAAEAAWADQLPFDSVVATADEMLADTLGNKPYYGDMAQMMASVARRVGQTNRIEKYLMAGIERTAKRTDQAGLDLHRDLLSDYSLHVLNDTTEAVIIKKKALGARWNTDPVRYFRFGEWCLRRNINLDEAEHYIRLATEQTTEDKPRAAHLRVLAELCFARGRTDEAIRLANESLALDPSAIWFEKKLAEWRASK